MEAIGRLGGLLFVDRSGGARTVNHTNDFLSPCCVLRWL